MQTVPGRLADHARKLERERDEKDEQIVALRESVKDADAAIRGCLKYMLGLPMLGSDLECEVMDDAHHALAKLKPFLTD